jgi:CHAT domain-containing protein
LAAEIRSNWSAYASLKYPEPLELTTVQGELAPREALIYYVLGPKRSCLFVITCEGFTHYDLPPQHLVDKTVNDLLRVIESSDPRSTRQSRRLEARLFEMLMRPALPSLDEVDKLWIAPDGALYFLPFETLLESSRPDAAPQSLLSKWFVGYVPSASAITSLPKTARFDPPGWFVAFADPVGDLIESSASERKAVLPSLPGALDEAQAIARLFPQHSRLYLGPEARQDNLFDNPAVEGARYLHFASHGFISEEPATSAILLSPDSRGDAFLQVSEIFNLNLRADVVVLSACDTGTGERLSGEGLVGLSRAFFYAGSRSLVVSLWPVPDNSTSQLMQHFYGHLAADLPPVEALRQAKLNLIADGTFRNPRYWAPFILLGAPMEEVTTSDEQPPNAHTASMNLRLKRE